MSSQTLSSEPGITPGTPGIPGIPGTPAVPATLPATRPATSIDVYEWRYAVDVQIVLGSMKVKSTVARNADFFLVACCACV